MGIHHARKRLLIIAFALFILAIWILVEHGTKSI